MTFQELYDKALSLEDVQVSLKYYVVGSSHLFAQQAMEHVKTVENPKKDNDSMEYKEQLSLMIEKINSGKFKEKKIFTYK